MFVEKDKILQGSKGSYRVIELIGSGKIGNVWKSQAISSNQKVAIKVLHSENFNVADVHVERFNREKNLGQSLKHSNLVEVVDGIISSDDKDQNFLVMEYVEGPPLSKLIEELNKKERIQIAVDIISGLNYLHEKSLIHRDLKPDNIIVTEDGNAIICDFGLLKEIQDPYHLTHRDDKIGSSLYISKHQAANPAKADKLDDIYSLCVCLYEIFTATQIRISWQTQPFKFGNEKLKELISSVLSEKIERSDYPSLKEILDFGQIICQIFFGIWRKSISSVYTEQENAT
ncbi:serine/threonine-protein kinase [Desulfococcaceae bacterium HSG7]|nr:serine/threonine-protein kinase [Desulfococcaceae bacterium HSG7]